MIQAVKIRQMRTLIAAGLAALMGTGTALAADDTLRVSAPIEVTGAIARAGQDILKGIELGVEIVNKSGRLGKYKIVLDVKDSASQPATAAALASEAGKSDSIAMLGPSLSSDAMAAAPIAQREKLPMIAIQANTEGIVETGEYVYRLTAPLYSFSGLTFKYLAKSGVRSIALSYVSNIPSVAGLGRDFAPKWATANGIKLVASEGTPANTTDFSTTIAKLIAANPDAIGLYNLDSQLTSLITGVRRAGFKGPLFVYSIAPTTLKAIGPAADGLLNAVDYSSALQEPSSVAFTKAFAEKFGSTAYVYNANGYDAVMFLTAALEKVVKSGKTPDRSELLKAMAEIAKGRFAAAAGDTHFDSKVHRDARVAGVLVRYNGGVPEIILKGNPDLDEQ